MSNNSVRGTIFKLNLHMEPMDGVHLADIDWEVDAYADGAFNKRITIKKQNARKVDEDNYIIAVDSAVGGAGEYSLTLTAYFPDGDCPNGIRVERASTKTGVKIVL